jgi:hypothetical protein
MPETYDRNLMLARFYATTAHIGKKGFNPEVVLYYNSDEDLIQIDETFGGKTFRQTVSGTKSGGGVIDQTIDYSVHYSSWSEV